MKRYFYADTIENFLNKGQDEILGEIEIANSFSLETTQRDSWVIQIQILKEALTRVNQTGKLFFEYSIPRLGRRIDVIVLFSKALFILEFKVGEDAYTASGVDQVYDYALDLKNFHETSQFITIVPILIATEADNVNHTSEISHDDNLLKPIKTNKHRLAEAIETLLQSFPDSNIDIAQWEFGRYCPTPTIIEAATSLYGGHNVEEISSNDAKAKNLTCTSKAISTIVSDARTNSKKVICFVTGVPGAGKTLVGLDIATKHSDQKNDLYSVFLSGNDPLVEILREALARDKVHREKKQGRKVNKSRVLSEVKSLIQNVHHFRDECLVDRNRPPIEHIALFDEAQRAWNKSQTIKFMKTKKKILDFEQSEPEYLISCLDRHQDWAVIVCLVGGGQEINTGEAGIGEWIEAVTTSFPNWNICISSRLVDSEYAAEQWLKTLSDRKNVKYLEDLHLAVSMRSFRAENVSLFVKQLLDLDVESAQKTLKQIHSKYPITITRDLQTAKNWLKSKARGTERYGIVASSQAQRLKPFAIDVKSKIDPVHWFLNGKSDVRSSYYLECVATEFQVQGLELDWVCVGWDADFRMTQNDWGYCEFRGNRWIQIHSNVRKNYLKNAYRVLLTRARQGMVIYIPHGDINDHTRVPKYYDRTFQYLISIGIESLDE